MEVMPKWADVILIPVISILLAAFLSAPKTLLISRCAFVLVAASGMGTCARAGLVRTSTMVVNVREMYAMITLRLFRS